MEVSPSSIPRRDEEEMALKVLLEAFGSLFSLEEIVSAYIKAGRNADLAGQVLSDDMQGSTSTNKTEISCEENINLMPIKQKSHSVSGGMVSSVIGKGYMKPVPVTNNSSVITKPLKLEETDLPQSVLFDEEGRLKSSKNNVLHKDMEEFLFRMLGDGFQMERGVIQQVLDICGYDVEKSMYKLIDLSSANLKEQNNVCGKSAEKLIDPNSEGLLYQKKCQEMDSCKGSNELPSYGKGRTLPRENKEREVLQKEVLTSLFFASNGSKESPRRVLKPARRSIALGKLVVGPPEDLIFECKTDSAPPQQNNKINEDIENSYNFLRQAVKEYRATMNEYYKSAVEAFVSGDHDKASKLMEKGHFFHQKAREADEESSRVIFGIQDSETEDEILLDLHDYSPKEALRLLKCHLSSLSAFKYLRLVIETDEEDITKGSRRRLVMKLLDKESIAWTETETAGAVLIRLDKINRKGLSFVKK